MKRTDAFGLDSLFTLWAHSESCNLWLANSALFSITLSHEMGTYIDPVATYLHFNQCRRRGQLGERSFLQFFADNQPQSARQQVRFFPPYTGKRSQAKAWMPSTRSPQTETSKLPAKFSLRGSNPEPQPGVIPLRSAACFRAPTRRVAPRGERSLGWAPSNATAPQNRTKGCRCAG
jgi:hypothetical protein